MARDQPAVVRAHLTVITDELERLEMRREELYATRLDLWLRGRALDPPMTQKDLATASRVTEGAVTQAMRKLRVNAGAGG